jgi:glyoxylase-like metal-dependent hydrolase (beta-lactamase superfamily II)
MRAMAVLGLYALQNGFMGFERSGLFYGEFSSDRVRIPIACWLVRTSDAMILFDTGLIAAGGARASCATIRWRASPKRTCLVHRLDLVGLEPDNVDMVVLSHLHYDHAGGAGPLPEVRADRAEGRVLLRPLSGFRSSSRSTTGRTSSCRAIAGASWTATPSSCPA